MRAVRHFRLCSCLLGIAVSIAGAEPPDRSAASFVPKNALLVAVVRDGDRRIAAISDWLDTIEFRDSDVYQKLTANQQFLQAQMGVVGFAATAGVDPWKAAGAALGRELAFAVVPGEEKKPAVLLAMKAREPALVDRMLNSVYTLHGLVREGKPDDSRSMDIDGVRVFNLAPGVFHCRVDDMLLVTDTREMMRTALALRGNEDACVTKTRTFADALKRVPDDAVAWAFVDAPRLRTFVPPEKLREGPRDNPLGGFIFGAWQQAVISSDAAAAWLTARDGKLRLEASVVSAEALPEAYRGFTPKKTAQITWSAADLPRFLSEIQLTRGWADLFAEREALLTTVGASQALQFTSTMSTLFGGMDFLNDVLPKVAAPTRFIAARQKFADAKLLPSPKLPAFALIQPLQSEAATEFSQRLASATQMALSLLSLDMASKNLPTYLIDIDRYREQRILFSTFSAPPATMGMKMDAEPKGAASGEPESDEAAKEPGDSASVRYNFLPAAVVVENQYIVATSRELLHDIIDQVLDAKTKAGDGAKAAGKLVDSLTIDGPSLIAILKDNRRELVINRMLEESESKAKAEQNIDMFLGLLEYTRSLRLTSHQDGKEFRAALEFTMRATAVPEKP